jgi:hypothetical protein
MPAGHLDHASNTTRFPSASEKTGLRAVRCAGMRQGSERKIAIEVMATKDKAGAVTRRPRLNALPVRDEESGSKGIRG